MLPQYGQRMRPLLMQYLQVCNCAEPVAEVGCVYQLPRPWHCEHMTDPLPPQVWETTP